MAFQDGDLLAALRIPDARGAVLRRRHHPLAVAAECRAPHAAVMAFQDGDLLAALRIPDARGPVDRRRHHPLAIAAERRATTRGRMAFQDGDLLPLSASQMRAVLSETPSPPACHRR